MKIIDVHNHPDWLGYNLDRFLKNMDEAHIDQCWLLSWETMEHEYLTYYREITAGKLLNEAMGPIPFSRCLSYVERAPERFILGYSPDPRLPDACDRLKAAHSIYGAKVCGEVKNRMMFDNPDAIRMFRLAGELGMPVLVHLQYNKQPTCHDLWDEWYGGTIEAFERAVAACPETNFLGHAVGFWLNLSDDVYLATQDYSAKREGKVVPGKVLKMLDQYPNLYCDLSAGSGYCALSRDLEFTRKFFIDYQDRLCFGRDDFDHRMQQLIDSLALPVGVREKIYSKNAEKLTGKQ